MDRITVKAIHDDIGIKPDTPGYGEVFGKRSRVALMLAFSNVLAPALTEDDYAALANEWDMPIGHIKGVHTVETPRGAFDDQGRPSNLYERHVFARNCVPKNRFNASNPNLSSTKGYGAGGYGKYSEQYDKLADACALDPEAAFRACSWGAFQVLGENAIDLGYENAYRMAKALTLSEAAHLDSFKRFVEFKGLVAKLRACVPGDPASCVPFVTGYNGTGYKTFNYHVKLADAIK